MFRLAWLVLAGSSPGRMACCSSQRADHLTGCLSTARLAVWGRGAGCAAPQGSAAGTPRSSVGPGSPRRGFGARRWGAAVRGALLHLLFVAVGRASHLLFVVVVGASLRLLFVWLVVHRSTVAVRGALAGGEDLWPGAEGLRVHVSVRFVKATDASWLLEGLASRRASCSSASRTGRTQVGPSWALGWWCVCSLRHGDRCFLAARGAAGMPGRAVPARRGRAGCWAAPVVGASAVADDVSVRPGTATSSASAAAPGHNGAGDPGPKAGGDGQGLRAPLPHCSDL